MSKRLGIQVKLLHETAGDVVSVELKSGELYRGHLTECEDNWNCQLDSIISPSRFCPPSLYFPISSSFHVSGTYELCFGWAFVLC